MYMYNKYILPLPSATSSDFETKNNLASSLLLTVSISDFFFAIYTDHKRLVTEEKEKMEYH